MKNTEEVVNTKNCPICCPSPKKGLPLSEFGICRSRKDGRNLYCKGCVRKKITDARQALKEYRSARKRYVSQPVDATSWIAPEPESDQQASQNYAGLLSKLSPDERVREAIRKGARTQKEIARETRLGKDETGDAIANLLLWTREIKTQIVGETRLYFLNESADIPIHEEEWDAPPRRKTIGRFGTIVGLGSGKKKQQEDEPKKVRAWAAA